MLLSRHLTFDPSEVKIGLLFEKQLLVAFPWVVASTGLGGCMVCVCIL